LPETGHGVVAELTALFNQVMDRSLHFNHEKQLERLLTREHSGYDEIGSRLAALDRQLGEDRPDLPALRTEIRELRHLIARGRGS
jgi:hypothetical protein